MKKLKVENAETLVAVERERERERAAFYKINVCKNKVCSNFKNLFNLKKSSCSNYKNAQNASYLNFKNCKNASFSNSGITLIALVITIIVLIILAAITLSMLSGQNGVLKRASEASETQKDAAEKEQVQLAVIAAMTNNDLGQLTDENLRNAISDTFGSDNGLDGFDPGPWIYTGERNVYDIDENGKLYSWGNNEHGQLGDGKTEDRSTPICISDIVGSELNGKKIRKYVNVTYYIDGDAYDYFGCITEDGECYLLYDVYGCIG